MKRLLDTTSSDENSESARRLLSSVDALPRSAARKRHVWNSVAQHAAGRPRFGAFLLAPAVLLVGASSLAAYQGAWPSTWSELLGLPVAASDSSNSSTSPVTSSTSPVTSSTSTPLTVPAPVIAPEAKSDITGSTAPTPAPSPSPVRVVPSRAAPSPVRAKTSAPRADESQLLVEALQARRAGDHARAERLAEQYSRTAPRGALAEEALIVALEAAVARRDPRAEGLAQSYLERHPQGRFRARAQKALAESRR